MTLTPPPQAAGVEELAAAIRRVRDVARRRAATFVAVFAGAALLILLVTFLWPGTFEARGAVLLQKIRSAGAVDYDARQPTTVVSGAVSQEEVNSEMAVLTSREVLKATAEAAGLSRLRPPLYVRIVFAPLRAYEWAYDWWHEIPYPTADERAVLTLADGVSVDRLKESNVLVVSYRSGSPRMAEAVLDELLRNYLDFHLRVHTRVDAERFFTDQAGRLLTEVTTLQDRLSSLRRTLDVADLTAAKEAGMREETALGEEESLLLRRASDTEARLASYRETLAANRSSVRTSTTTRANTQGLDGMRAQVLQLELEQIRLETRYRESAPPLVENARKLEAARQSLQATQQAVAQESTSAVNPTAFAIEEESARTAAEAAGIRARLQAVRGQRDRERAALRTLERQALAGDRLELELKSAKDRYAMYLDRAERARVDAALDRTGVTDAAIVQHAAASPKPVRPARLVSFVAAVAGGLIVATLVCAWLELAAGGLAAAIEAAAPRADHVESL